MLGKAMIAGAAALTAAIMGFAAPSTASTVSLGGTLPALGQPATANPEFVQYRRAMRPGWSYNRARHGLRYRYRHGRYAHYYRGWWYPRAWWRTGPVVAFGVAPLAGGYYGSSAGSGQVQWCLNRYRSYDPRTDTYMGYDGLRHRCNSPY